MALLACTKTDFCEWRPLPLLPMPLEIHDNCIRWSSVVFVPFLSMRNCHSSLPWRASWGTIMVGPDTWAAMSSIFDDRQPICHQEFLIWCTNCAVLPDMMIEPKTCCSAQESESCYSVCNAWQLQLLCCSGGYCYWLVGMMLCKMYPVGPKMRSFLCTDCIQKSL